MASGAGAREPSADVSPPATESSASVDVSRVAVEHMSVGVVCQDDAGRVVFANPAACRMLGRPLDVLRHHPFDDVLSRATREDGTALPPEDIPTRVAMRTGKPVAPMVLGLDHPTRDGRRWLLVRAVPEPALGSIPAPGIVVTLEDLSAEKLAEGMLREQGRLLDQVHEAVMVWSPDTGITLWNTGAEELYGYAEREALGHAPEELLESRDPGGGAGPRRQLLRSGAWKGDIERRRRDGARIVVEAQLALVGSGKDAIVVEADRDVTDRRRAEERLHFLMEAGRILTSSLDIEATLTMLTQLAVPAMADWCVVDLVDADGMLSRLAITHRDPALAAVAEELRRRYPRLSPDQPHTLWTVLRNQRPFVDPAVDQDRFVAQGRDPRHVELLSQLGFAAELVVPLIARDRVLGAITLALANRERSFTSEDVAHAVEVGRTAALAIDNARLYAEARSAEAYYRSLLTGTGDGVTVMDEGGRFIELNAAAERMLGYSAEELNALRAAGGTISAEDPAVRDAAWAQIRDSGQWSGQWTMRRKDGSTVPIDATATRVALPEQSVYIAVWRDASQRVRLERLQRDFFAMVAHDLRTPLTVIRSHAQLLERRGEYRQAAVDGILAASDRMVGLINDIADLVALQDGHIALHRAPMDLADIAQRVVAALPEESQRRVHIDRPEHPVTGRWDPDRLGQVLQNLVDNALAHAPASDVRVGIAADGAEARVSVTDEGPGIAPQHLPLLFERFYRASATGAGGLGLGLYICRMLVEAHGGTISARSTPGQGSTFWFTLPGAS